jgi:hypothetical protein
LSNASTTRLTTTAQQQHDPFVIQRLMLISLIDQPSLEPDVFSPVPIPAPGSTAISDGKQGVEGGHEWLT